MPSNNSTILHIAPFHPDVDLNIWRGVRSPPMLSPTLGSKASDTLLTTGGMFCPRKGSKYNGFDEEVEVEVNDANSTVRSETEKVKGVGYISFIFKVSDSLQGQT